MSIGGSISVIGSGAWGTALAQVMAEAGRRVVLYARDKALAEAMMRERRNPAYLPLIPLHNHITITHDPAAAVRDASLVLLVVPAQHMREALRLFKPFLPPHVPLVNAAKGIEAKTGKFLSDVAREEVPTHPYAVLSGPTFADEVAAGLPAAVTLATATDESRGSAWAEMLHGKTFRPYLSKDIAGVETSGAVKNVIAIACGIVEGKGLGRNARAAVMTRGMAEIRRLGGTRGALPDTFMGLSGIGDLTLTCNSMSSRNFSLGCALGQGRALTDILGERKGVTEGIATARAVAAIMRKQALDLPICAGVDHILHGGGRADEIIVGLLSRSLKSENG